MILRDLAIILASRFRPASRIAAALAKQGPQVLYEKVINELTTSQRSDALWIIAKMFDAGVLVKKGAVLELKQPSEWFRDLSLMLEGIDLANTELEPKSSAEIVLTRPSEPSELDCALRARGPGVIRIQDTKNAFRDIADHAKQRLVVMTPFLDRHGALWLQDLFSIVSPEVTKILILRFLSEGHSSHLYPEGYTDIASFLSNEGVKVYDFAVSRPGTRFMETFHAKCLVADTSMAYIGSSNMNRHSLDNSMELGVLVKGEPVQLINFIVKSILEIAPLFS
jgi:hypothetical protein